MSSASLVSSPSSSSSSSSYVARPVSFSNEASPQTAPLSSSPKPPKVYDLYSPLGGELALVFLTIDKMESTFRKYVNIDILSPEEEKTEREALQRLQEQYGLVSGLVTKLLEAGDQQIQERVKKDLKTLQGRITELEGLLTAACQIKEQYEKVQSLQKEFYQLDNTRSHELKGLQERAITLMNDPKASFSVSRYSIRLVTDISERLGEIEEAAQAREAQRQKLLEKEKVEAAKKAEQDKYNPETTLEDLVGDVHTASMMGEGRGMQIIAIEERYSSLPPDMQGRIEGKIWKLFGCPNGDDQFGKKNILTDLYRLEIALRSLDEFPRGSLETQLKELATHISAEARKLKSSSWPSDKKTQIKELLLLRVPEDLQRLPADTLGRIYGNIYQLAKEADPHAHITDPEFGKNNVLTDFARLAQAIQRLPEYPKEEQKE